MSSNDTTTLDYLTGNYSWPIIAIAVFTGLDVVVTLAHLVLDAWVEREKVKAKAEANRIAASAAQAAAAPPPAEVHLVVNNNNSPPHSRHHSRTHSRELVT